MSFQEIVLERDERQQDLLKFYIFYQNIGIFLVLKRLVVIIASQLNSIAATYQILLVFCNAASLILPYRFTPNFLDDFLFANCSIIPFLIA